MDLIEKTSRDGWSDVESNFFVERYNMLKHEVGKGKTFITRKSFFQWISEEVRRNLQSFKTEQQITSRFYTLTRKMQKTNDVAQRVGTSVDLNHETVVNGSIDLNHETVVDGSSNTVEFDSISVVDLHDVDDSNKSTIDGKVEIVHIDLNDTMIHSTEANSEVFEKQGQDMVIDLNGRSTQNAMESVDGNDTESRSVSGMYSNETEFDWNDPAIDSGVDIIDIGCNGPSYGLNSIGIFSTKSNEMVSRDYKATGTYTRIPENNLGWSCSSSKLSSANVGIATIYNVRGPTVAASSPAPAFGTEIPSSSRATAISNLPSLVRASNSTSQSVLKIRNTKAIFTVAETKYLLDQYYSYMDEIGPMKLFRTKSSMWETLASKMNTVFESTRTADELSKRVTDVMSIKKAAVNQHRVSGVSRQEVEYEEEIDKITALDDSIEPEVMRGVKSVKYKTEKREKHSATEQQAQKKPRWDKPNKKGILSTLSETMLSMEKRKSEQEAAKEERRKESHKALLEMMQALKKPVN